MRNPDFLIQWRGNYSTFEIAAASGISLAEVNHQFRHTIERSQTHNRRHSPFAADYMAFREGVPGYGGINEHLARDLARDLGGECAQIYRGIEFFEASRVVRFRPAVTQTLPSEAMIMRVAMRAFELKGMAYCMHCGNTGKAAKLGIDHIRPRAHCPEDRFNFDNFQVLCGRCNSRKADRHETDYRTGDERDLMLHFAMQSRWLLDLQQFEYDGGFKRGGIIYPRRDREGVIREAYQ